MAAGFALGAADFEDVGKIGVELKADCLLHRRATVIAKADALVTGALPEKLATKNMERAAGNNQIALTVDVRVRQVDGEKVVSLFDVGA